MKPHSHHRRAGLWCAVAVAVACAWDCQANPEGELVRHGQVEFDRTDGALRILQGSDKAIIDWQSFSIGAGEWTEFVQPGSNAASLNFVTGFDVSRLDGVLRSNGTVFLINPNGIVIGPTGTVDVGGFVASTLKVSENEFLAGEDLNFRGDSPQGIVNLGRITATLGDVFVIAPTVTNRGTIQAPNGTVGLAAGNDVLLKPVGDGSGERIFVRGASGAAKADGVVNEGTIKANLVELKAGGGNVYAMAVRNEGRVAATGVTREGGQIFLRGGGGGAVVRNTGTLEATRENGAGGHIEIDAGAQGRVENEGEVRADSSVGKGGEVVLLGSEISLGESAQIVTDGAGGGGEIWIGGGLRESNSSLLNAQNVQVAEGAILSADGLGNAAGGSVVVFADNRLTFLGTLSAQGGIDGGDGGVVQLYSGSEFVLPDLSNQFDLAAPAPDGAVGSLVVITNDITIVHGTLSGTIGGSPASANLLVDADINQFLDGSGSLVIQPLTGPGSGNVGMATQSHITWTSANSLTILADGNFSMAGGVDAARISSLGAGALTINAGNAIVLGDGATLSANAGEVNLISGLSFRASPGSAITTVDGDVTIAVHPDPYLLNQVGVSLNGTQVATSGTGNISISGFSSAPSSNFRVGLLMNNSVVESTSNAANAGGITLIGGVAPLTQSGGAGLFISWDSEVRSVNGDISLSGTNMGTADGGMGTLIHGQVTSTGVGADAAGITVSGVGSGLGPEPVSGTNLGGSALISSVDGDISINGEVQGTFVGTTEADGLWIGDTAAVRTSGVGGITLSGSDPLGTYGVRIDSTSAPFAVSTAAGGGAINILSGDAVLIDGAQLGTLDGNLQIRAQRGVVLRNGAGLTTTLGNLELIGNETGGADGVGVHLSDATLATTDGSINIIGIAGDQPMDAGIVLASSSVSSSGSGGIRLEGRGSMGVGLTSGGVRVEGSILRTQDGSLEVTGVGNAAGAGFQMSGPLAEVGGASMTGDLIFDVTSMDLAGGAVQSTGRLTVRPIDPTSNIYLGQGAPDLGLQLTDLELATLADGFESITMGDELSGSGVIRVYGASFSDPFRLVSPGSSGGIELSGDLVGTGDASFLFQTGGNVGLNGSITTQGGEVVIDGPAQLNGDFSVQTQDGNIEFTSGITGAGTVRDLVLDAGTQGSVFLNGAVGSGGLIGDVQITSFDFNLQTDVTAQGGVTIDTKAQFALAAPATIRAGETISITSNASGSSGDFTAIDIAGTLQSAAPGVGVSLAGTSGNGAGNLAVLIRDTARIDAALGSVEITGQRPGAGAADLAIQMAGTLNGGTGVQMTSEQGNLLLDGPIATGGLIQLSAASSSDTKFIIDSGLDPTLLRVVGGTGSDTLSFAGFANPINLAASQWQSVELVLGSQGTQDRFASDASQSSLFQFTGANQFDYQDALRTTQVIGFENVQGSAYDDVFRFLSSGTLSGNLDGGGELNGDALDYSVVSQSITIDFYNQTATNIGGQFYSIENFIGGSAADFVFLSPNQAGEIQITGTNEFSMPGQFTAVGFESLKGGDAATVFRFLPGGRLDGSLTGGSSSGDVLTYQDFGRAVTIDLENRRATGIGGTFSNLETLVGSALGADSITLTNSNDFVLTRENNSGLVNGVLSFRDIEGINGGAGNDTFRFEGYATFSNLISGGSGFDTLGIYAQAGFHNFVTSENVFIREGQVSINPVWNFSSIEALVVDTGGGNDTVTTEFTSFSQTLQGGAGDDTLNFRQAPFGSTSPVSQAGYGKVGFESFEHLNFAPPPNASDTPATLGELLQIQLNKAAPLNPTLLGTGLVTFATSTTQLGLGINLGPTLLAGVSAIPSSTSIVSAEDFDYGIMVYPFALDNSGIQPSNLGIQLLQQALALDANIELLNALELTLGFVLIYPDGAVAMDLSMVAPPQTAILVIARQLSPFSQIELQSALEMENRFWATQADGAFPLGVLPITLSPATLTRLSEILSDPSQAELNAAFNAE